MRVCYLPPAPPSAAPVAAAWARALRAETVELHELARRATVARAFEEPLDYDVALVDLSEEALPAIAALARILISHPRCKLVLCAARPIPEDARELERFRAVLQLADLVICPTHALYAEIRRMPAAAHRLPPPGASDVGTWAKAHGSGVHDAADRNRRLTVVSAERSHASLLREMGPLAYLWTLIGGRIQWLHPESPSPERERLLGASDFVYLPKPLSDAGALAADCARFGAILIAHLGYDGAKSCFPYTTFDETQGKRRGLLLLWLYGSSEFRQFFRECARFGAVWLADENRRVEFLRRLEYQFPEQSHALPEGGPPSLLDQIQHRRGPLDVPCEARECLLVCLVRNGREHVSAFLSHYRSLGVKHFFFIDNGSDDGTLELLEAEPGVTTYTTALPHKYHEREIRRLIIERHCRGSWCLNVDIDELFDYPHSEELGLVGLLAYLSRHRFSAMAGYLLDMYAKENGFGEARELELEAAYRHYDISNIRRADYFTHEIKAFCDHNELSSNAVECYFGGIRKTLFGSKLGEDYLLTKHPLIFLDGVLEPVTHPHYSNHARVADVTCVLRHYKFTPSFKAKVAESRASKRYVKFAQGQYDQYQKRIEGRDSLVIDTPGTQRWRSARDLVGQGFLTTSLAYEEHVREASRGDVRRGHGAVAELARARAGQRKDSAVPVECGPDASEHGPSATCSMVGASGAGAGARGRMGALTVSALLAVLIMAALAVHGRWPHPAAGGPARPMPELLAVLAVLFDGAVCALGLLSMLVVAAAAAYLCDGLWRRRRPLSLAIAVLSCGLAFTPAGIGVVSFVCGVVVIANALAYAYLASKALLRARSGLSPSHVASASSLPYVSVVIPARDEDAVIEETLRALDRCDYPGSGLEIVVIDDGSVDQTRARVQALASELTRPLRLVAHERSQGKARRLNQLLPSLESEFVLLLDADHHVAPDLLIRLLPHFALGEDVACVQAASAVRNGGANWLARALEMEYLFRCQGIYPGKPMGIFVGSGGLFRRGALLAAGGFDPNMLTEDVELSYRLYASGQRIAYEPEACTFELAALDFRNFFNQRYRWMRGLWQAMLLHAPRAARSARGRWALPYFIQCTSDGLVALCLSMLSVYVFLEQLGVIAPQTRVPLYAMSLSTPFAFGAGFVRAGKVGSLLRLPLVPLYAVLHSIPMAWALIDGYVFGKPAVWVKTDRGAAGRARPRTNAPSREAVDVRV